MTWIYLKEKARRQKAFSIHQAKRRPLKLGIRADILTALGGAVTETELSRALGCYTGNKVYRSRLLKGAWRIDLNGEPAGSVSAQHAIARVIPTPKSRAAPSPTPTPSPPSRGDSLAGLRAAAQARKGKARLDHPPDGLSV